MVEASMFGEPIVWRDTMRAPRLLIFDARLIFCCALLIIHLRIWTVMLLVVGIIVFWLIERAGLRFPSALRALRSTIAGAARPAMSRKLYRGSITTAFEGHPLLGAQRKRRGLVENDAKQPGYKSRKNKQARVSAEPSLGPAE